MVDREVQKSKNSVLKWTNSNVYMSEYDYRCIQEVLENTYAVVPIGYAVVPIGYEREKEVVGREKIMQK